ncbi:MAG TPA: anaerobic ribonucleoside-triphosphate reductase activating protein, partial [Ruminococcaceae bacterium]|nr:anaerobic ribonucleoside-triphosphate reductase activating protein [Oscillospiraceae bacterium]
LAQTDILIDGPFVLAQKDLSLRFRGSRNQRVIDMNETRRLGRVALCREE